MQKYAIAMPKLLSKARHDPYFSISPYSSASFLKF